MFKLKSNNITDFPFNEFEKLNASECEDLAKELSITAYNSWMLPQILAYYGRWNLTWNAGKVNSQATVKTNITTPWEIGLWRVATILKRGSLVKTQNNPEFASYSALVPLILAGAKRFQGVKYQQWDIDENTRLVEKGLREAMFWTPEAPELVRGQPYYGLGSEELLELREQGITVKSGARAGQTQKPTSAWRLNGMRGTVLQNAPALATTMLAQIWVAHPALRTEYMVLDPNDWDFMPEPLIAETVFVEPPKPVKIKPKTLNYMPWD